MDAKLRKRRKCKEWLPAAEFKAIAREKSCNYSECQNCRLGFDIFATAKNPFEIPENYNPQKPN